MFYFCNTIRQDAGALSLPNWKKGWAKPLALQHKLHVMVPWKRTTKWSGIAVHIKKKHLNETELYELDTDPKAFTVQRELPALKRNEAPEFQPQV